MEHFSFLSCKLKAASTAAGSKCKIARGKQRPLTEEWYTSKGRNRPGTPVQHWGYKIVTDQGFLEVLAANLPALLKGKGQGKQKAMN